MPTIKYYVREGLLPPGELTSPNQATYGESHEHRLRLIRALLDVGGLKVAAIADVLAAVDDPDKSVHKVLGVATDLLVPRYADSAETDCGVAAAREQVDELIERRGWRVNDDCPARNSLATAVATLEGVGHGGFTEVLDTYADAAELMAKADLAYVAGATDRHRVVERAIVGTAMGEALVASLRHLAHVDRSAWLYENSKRGAEEAEGGEADDREAGHGEPDGREAADDGAGAGAVVPPGESGREVGERSESPGDGVTATGGFGAPGDGGDRRDSGGGGTGEPPAINGQVSRGEAAEG